MKNLFNKSSIMYYSMHEEIAQKLQGCEQEYIDSILSPSSRSSSCWFTSLTLFGNGFKSIRKYWEGVHSGTTYPSGPTAKVCPAIHSVLDNSLLVKSPCDIVITARHDGSYMFESSAPELIRLSQHTKEQLGGNIAPFKNKLALKFELAMNIASSGDYDYIFLQPHFHNDVPFNIINGVVPGKYSIHWMSLNVIALFDIPDIGIQTHIIKKGTVIAYLWSPTKLRMKKAPSNTRKPDMPTRFFRGMLG